jgi:hypothetical protein
VSEAEGYWLLLREPVLWLVVATLGLLAWRWSGVRKRRLRQRRASLRLRARQAETPRERRELMLQWSELGGLREHARVQGQRNARAEGQRARATGRPLSANPYRHALWGPGRLWKRGWKSVDRQIRWIRKHRR